jgi:hypothetical protein
MFVLRPDGRWVDFNAYACQGKPEVMDEIVFPTMAEVMITFGKLTGPPQVVDLPIDEAGLKTWIAHRACLSPWPISSTPSRSVTTPTQRNIMAFETINIEEINQAGVKPSQGLSAQSASRS